MNKPEMKSIIHKSPAIYSTESCKKAINWFDENINIAKPVTKFTDDNIKKPLNKNFTNSIVSYSIIFIKSIRKI